MLMFRSFSLMHEAVHRSLSPYRWINVTVGILCGALCMLPFAQWRELHLTHHLWSGNLDQDPTMKLVKNYEKIPRTLRVVIEYCWKFWLPLLALMQHLLFWTESIVTTFKNPRSIQMWISNIAFFGFWLMIIHYGPKGFLFHSLLPGIFIYFLLVEIVNLPHHLALEHKLGDERYPLWDQHRTARSCTYPRILSHWVFLNFNFHTEHHLYPDLPWFELEALSHQLSEHLGSNYNHDPMFKWILSNRKRPLAEIINASAPRTAERLPLRPSG
jgi:fatty acid desaturase